MRDRFTLLLGCPRIVRADRGSENAKVAFMQPFLRRDGTDSQADWRSFHYGRSVANQVCACDALFTIHTIAFIIEN